MIEPIISRHRYSLLLMVCLVCVCAAVHAQNENVLDRENDERATSAEERKQAIATLLNEGRQALNAGDSAKAAGFMNRAGRLKLNLNQPNESLATYQAALILMERAGDSSTKVESLNGIAAAYTHLSKCDQAQPPLQEAIASSARLGYIPGKAESLLIKAECQNYKDHTVALRSAQESLQLWQSVGRKWWIAKSYAAIGHYQLAQNDVIEATASIIAALNLWRELNIVPEQAEALINLGFIEYRKGAWQASLSFLTEAQGLIDEKAEPFKMGQVMGGIGEAFIESGLPETGLPKLRQSLEYFRQAQKPHSIIILNWDIGRTYYLIGDHPQALATLQTTLTDAESIQETAVAALCNDFLGRTYFAMGDRATALRHFQTALSQYVKVGDPMEAARTKALLAQVHELDGELGRARQEYRDALRSFRSLSDHLNESATLYALGRFELRQNNLDAAEDYLRRSIDVTEDIRRVSTSSDLMAAFSATVHERYESYIECLMRQHQAQPAQSLDVRAFEASELARGRSLAEVLRATETNLLAGLDPNLAKQEKALRQSLRVKEDDKVRLLSRAYKKEELDALESELAGLKAQYKQVTESIHAQFPSYDEIRRPTPRTLAEIQRRVVRDDNTLLLEYSLGARRSYVWAVSPTEFSSYELPARFEIESEVRRFYDLLTANQPIPGLTFEQQQERVRQAEAQLPAVTASLSKLLLGPVADKLGTKRLLIVADGPLQYIPFQALLFPGKTDLTNSGSNAIANERLLFREHEIINEPSASILEIVLSESAKREPPSRSVAVLADPVFESDDPRITSAIKPTQGTTQIHETEFHQALRDVNLSGNGHIPRLLASRGEAAAIMSAAPWRSAFEAMGFEASRATVMKADLSDYRIVHFATHGLLNNEHPELSGIVLSLFDQNGQPQDGYLRLYDIYNLKLPVDLVVLSACNTGLGKDVKGEGLIGLTRGFMYAGASTVIASLWKVDDEATAELMRLFYGYLLRDGLSPAAALRKAQVAMSQQKRWQSPYYWAGFVIQGQYHQTVRTHPFPTSHLALWLFVAATLSAVSFYVLKRRRKQIV